MLYIEKPAYIKSAARHSNSVPDLKVGSVFGPQGSGSVNICTDPELDPSINKQTTKKTLDFYSFMTF
jgi:hypothetical protein